MWGVFSFFLGGGGGEGFCQCKGRVLSQVKPIQS